jgi:hypothetical protein
MAVSGVNGGAIPLSPNAIINGAFDIWQRGTSFTGTTSSLYTADRWEVRNGTTPTTRTVSRQTFSPGEIESIGIGDGQFYIRNACTGSTSYLRINQRIEDVRTLAGQTVTVSFWARATGGASLQAIFVQEFGAGGSSSTSTTALSITPSTSWQRVTGTVNLPSMVGKTVGTSSFLHLIIQLSTVTDGNLDIWGVQLEAGLAATPFRRNANSIQGELAACQRYYQMVADGSLGSTKTICIATVYSPTTVIAHLALPVAMRTVPTVDQVTGTAFYGIDIGNSGLNTNSISISGQSSGTHLRLDATVSGGTTGQAGVLRLNNAAARLAFSAEL